MAISHDRPIGAAIGLMTALGWLSTDSSTVMRRCRRCQGRPAVHDPAGYVQDAAHKYTGLVDYGESTTACLTADNALASCCPRVAARMPAKVRLTLLSTYPDG